MKEEIKKFFTENNKSGHKSTERWLSKNKPELYLNILNNSNDKSISFLEKIFLYVNDIRDVPKCPYCGNNVKYAGTLNRGYSKYCSITCLNKSQEHKDLVKNNCYIKYGVYSYNQLDSVKENKRKSSIEKYGVDSPMKSIKIKLNLKNVLLNKYGVDSPMKIKHVIENRKKLVENGTEFNIANTLGKIKDETIKFISHDHEKNFIFHYIKCDNDFKINSNLLTSRMHWNSEICINCNPYKSYSTVSNIIIDELLPYNLNIIIKDKNILNNKEIDIYFPDQKIGIEYNGLFWHSDRFKSKTYHLDKTTLAESKGVQLLHIFDNEWNKKEDIVMSLIKSKFSIFTYNYDIKECEMKEINDIEEIKTFTNDNDIQGFINGDVYLGLCYKNKLIATTIIKRTKNESEFELLRFTTKLNYNVNESLNHI
jgi:hypothetical protein